MRTVSPAQKDQAKRNLDCGITRSEAWPMHRKKNVVQARMRELPPALPERPWSVYLGRASALKGQQNIRNLTHELPKVATDDFFRMETSTQLEPHAPRATYIYVHTRLQIEDAN